MRAPLLSFWWHASEPMLFWRSTLQASTSSELLVLEPVLVMRPGVSQPTLDALGQATRASVGPRLSLRSPQSCSTAAATDLRGSHRSMVRSLATDLSRRDLAPPRNYNCSFTLLASLFLGAMFPASWSLTQTHSFEFTDDHLLRHTQREVR